MDRSQTARVARPFGMGVSRRAAPVRGGGARAGARAPSGRSRPLSTVPRLIGSLLAATAFVWQRRRARIMLLSALIALPVLFGGWVLLRHSSFVAVRSVRVSGVHGPEAQAIDAALVAAARHMSTLDVSPGALRAAVAPFRVVREVRAVPHVPHGLSIEVVEQLPVAALQVGGARTAVAADGVVLGPALLSSALPTVNGYSWPGAGQRVRDGDLLGYLSVLGAAPSPLAKLITRVYTGPDGITVAMHNGLLAYFGDATRPHAKWFSLARVLADHSSAGASYVDVRLPTRPAAGFPAGAGPTSAGGVGSTGEQTSAAESTVAALAAGLSSPGGAASSPAPAEPAAAPSSESSSSAGAAAGSPAGESAQTPSTPGGEVTQGSNTPGG